MDLGYRVVRAAVRAEPVRARLEVRLEDGLQHQLERGLDHPVGHGRYPELAELAAFLRDHHLPHLHRPELPAFSESPDLFQEHPAPPSRFSMPAAVAPSMPGVFAPVLALTRGPMPQPGTSGSQTRLNRSPNRREDLPPPSGAAWPASPVPCRVPRRLPQRRAARPSGRAPGFPGASSGITDSFPASGTLPPFPMWPALPAPEYYGGSAPPAPSAGVAPIRPAPWQGGGQRNGHGRFPRSLLSGRRARHPALPLRPRHGYPAALHRGLPSQASKTRTRVPRP